MDAPLHTTNCNEIESHRAAATVAALADTALEAAQLHLRNLEMIVSNCAARFAVGSLSAKDLEALELYVSEVGTWLGVPSLVMAQAVDLHTTAAEHAATSPASVSDAEPFFG